MSVDFERDLGKAIKGEPAKSPKAALARLAITASEEWRRLYGPLDSSGAQIRSLPEKIRKRETIEIGGKTAQELEAELQEAGINISSYAREMLHSPDFTTLPTPQPLEIVRERVQDLGFTGLATIDQIYRRAQELGYERVPAETGPHLRLQDKDQPMGEWYFIGMKQIADSDGDPHVFELGRDGYGLWLRGRWADPGLRWDPGREFVFGFRK